MPIRNLAVAAVALLLLSGAAPDAEDRTGRYVMTPVEGGFLRLDSQTGAVSMCQRTTGRWSCEAVPDDRQAQQSDIERLAAENRELKSAVKRLEEMLNLPESEDGSRRADRGGPKLQLPSEQDVDRAMSYIQGMMRKFREKMRELETDKDRRSL
jgi:hypothetical protein